MRTWRDITEREQTILEEITFADLVARARRQSENMYYI